MLECMLRIQNTEIFKFLRNLPFLPFPFPFPFHFLQLPQLKCNDVILSVFLQVQQHLAVTMI